MSANTLSRRSFLKASVMTAGAVAAASIPRAKADSNQALCTLFDLRKCIGCEACVEACRESNDAKFPQPADTMPTMIPQSRVKVEDWSSDAKRAVSDRLTPYNWLFVQSAEGEYQGEPFELYAPRRCMHCTNAPCANLCPFGAAHQETNGIVRIHADICMGGAKCKQVCPWHIPQRQSGTGLHMELMPQYAGNGVMYKCDRCYNLLADGESPACIDACPEEVQTIGPRDQIVRQAHMLAKEIDGYIYGETENGGTNTIYVSPIPFEVLNAAMDKGPGRPPLSPVADTMAQANNLSKALLLAPLAGAAAALLRFLNLGKPGQQNDGGKESR